jgi:hypothetical protein
MHVYERLRRVSQLQSQIRALASKIALYEDSLNEQHTPFAHLAYLQACNTAWPVLFGGCGCLTRSGVM